ncbi:MAG: flavin reductase [Planctomycetes bacterium]|nr:flavin reductase [Planctomycetota bacterium]
MAEPRRPVPDFARALACVPSGLFVLTAGTGTAATGCLVSFVQQVGFEPPALSVALKRGRHIETAVRATGRFCLSVLDESQAGLLAHFARGFDPGEPAFEGVETALDADGVPYLSEALAWLSCRLLGEVTWSDHVLFGAAVQAGARRDGEGRPMVHIRKNGLSY